MSNLIVDIPSFNQDKIRPGHYLIIYDQRGAIQASGIVLSVKELEIKMAIFDKSGNDTFIYDSTEGENYFPGLKPYHLKIEQIANRTFQIRVINPLMIQLEEGKEDEDGFKPDKELGW